MEARIFRPVAHRYNLTSRLAIIQKLMKIGFSYLYFDYCGAPLSATVVSEAPLERSLEGLRAGKKIGAKGPFFSQPESRNRFFWFFLKDTTLHIGQNTFL